MAILPLTLKTYTMFDEMTLREKRECLKRWQTKAKALLVERNEVLSDDTLRCYLRGYIAEMKDMCERGVLV